ncbi:MAG: hypothetical protein JNL01_11925 [Bdellovibrionales bacterium]|nr:hypothetical protein [Bdellovibrionales bacterium]
MRLVDFLIHVMVAHAQTLQRLAALFGEEALIELLEKAGDRQPESDPNLVLKWKDFFEEKVDPGPSAYAEIENAVRDINLPAVFEFHLWSYPYYRAFIEGPIDLQARIIRSSQLGGNPLHDRSMKLIEDATDAASQWIRSLELPSDLSKQAESVAQIPWLKFRADSLRRMGLRTLGAI